MGSRDLNNGGESVEKLTEKDVKDVLKTSREDIDKMFARIKEMISAEDYIMIERLISCVLLLYSVCRMKNVRISVLVRKLFGFCKTEKKQKEKKPEKTPEKESGSEAAEKATEKTKGHGRRGPEDFPDAERITVSHETLEKGALCPDCERGTLKELEPSTHITIASLKEFSVKIFELQKLRCSLCGALFTADLTEGVQKEKYDPAIAVKLALLKYGYGMPFNRISLFFLDIGLYLPQSTAWDLIDSIANIIQYPYRNLLRFGAQAELFHNDDTSVRILSLMEENKKDNPKRKGMFTTGIICVRDGFHVALYFSGRSHAGENMSTVLEKREKDLPPPILMCDALDRNIPPEFEMIISNCIPHGRRKFVECEHQFPEEVNHVITELAKVYQHNSEAKKQEMNPFQRLQYHQEKSGPVMNNLHIWLADQLEKKKVEPNSELGKAIRYMLKHWGKLTRFLQIPGVPLDNNLCERSLKKFVLGRKNSYFFKSQHGADVADMFLSLIQTCNLNKINPFKYLLSVCKNTASVKQNPEKWSPWNYQETENPQSTIN